MRTIVLDSTKTLTAVLNSAVTSDQPEFMVAYADNNGTSFTEGSNEGELNSTTPVTLVSAPASGTRRVIKSFTIYNKDNADVTVSLIVDSRTVASITLNSGDSLTESGVYNNEGKFKSSFTATASEIGSAIDNATEKTTPVDTDKFSLFDTALKSISWSNIKSALSSVFATLSGGNTFSGDQFVDGGVGIGTDNIIAGYVFQVNGNMLTIGGNIVAGLDGTASAPSLSINDGDSGFFRASPNTIGVSTNGLERMRIDSSGNVGIGTTNPSAKLEVHADSLGQDGLDIYNSLGNRTINLGHLSGGASYLRLSDDLGVGKILLRSVGGDSYIDTGGSVGIGTNSPSAKLDVVTSSSILQRWARGSNIIKLQASSGASSGYGFYDFARGAYDIWLENGNVGIGATTPSSKLDVNGNTHTNGISFDGGANVLSDYEEGTFTPSFNGYTGFDGYYERHGNIVICHITGNPSIPSGAITGAITVTGLPFISSSNGGYETGLLNVRRGDQNGNGTGANAAAFGIVAGNSSEMNLYRGQDLMSGSVFNGAASTFDGSYITQNSSTSIHIHWIFTYKI